MCNEEKGSLCSYLKDEGLIDCIVLDDMELTMGNHILKIDIRLTNDGLSI